MLRDSVGMVIRERSDFGYTKDPSKQLIKSVIQFQQEKDDFVSGGLRNNSSRGQVWHFSS